MRVRQGNYIGEVQADEAGYKWTIRKFEHATEKSEFEVKQVGISSSAKAALETAEREIEKYVKEDGSDSLAEAS